MGQLTPISMNMHTPTWLDPKTWQSDRWKTAISRNRFSAPMRLAVERKIIRPNQPHLDFGCGRGDDVRRLRQQGLVASGYDPYWKPDTPIAPAPTVSLLFVINVIEQAQERVEVLKFTWSLTQDTLIVAVRTDGVGEMRTSINTFQKFYPGVALKNFIQQTLPNVYVESLGNGICMVRSLRRRS